FGGELVAHLDIGVVVLVVMVFERLLRHEGSESLIVVGQFGKRESHAVSPSQMMSGLVGRVRPPSGVAGPTGSTRGQLGSRPAKAMRRRRSGKKISALAVSQASASVPRAKAQ